MTATDVQASMVDLREVGAELGCARLVVAWAAGAAVTASALLLHSTDVIGRGSAPR